MINLMLILPFNQAVKYHVLAGKKHYFFWKISKTNQIFYVEGFPYNVNSLLYNLICLVIEGNPC